MPTQVLTPQLSEYDEDTVNASVFQAHVSDSGAAAGRRLKQSLPSQVNWRTGGKVTPVRNQGSCGECLQGWRKVCFSVEGSGLGCPCAGAPQKQFHLGTRVRTHAKRVLNNYVY
eukprot:365808-Chlamydomonas_euryale.AAC.25